MRLDQPHLLLGAEPAQLDAHHALDERGDAILGPRHQQQQDRQRRRLPQQIADHLQAGEISPLQPVHHDHQRLDLRQAPEQVAQPADDEIAPVVGGILLGVRVLLARHQLGQAGHGLLARGRLGVIAEHPAEHVLGLLQGVIEPHPGDEAQQIGDGGERQLALHRRALHVDDARLRRQLGEEGVDQRRLANPHLPDDRARDHVAAERGLARGRGRRRPQRLALARGPHRGHLSAALHRGRVAQRRRRRARQRRRHRAVEGGVEIGALGVAAHQIAGRERQLVEPLLARERPLQHVRPHLSRHVAPGHLLDVERRRVGPAEIPPHQPVDAPRDPRRAERRRLPHPIREVVRRLLQRVVHEVPLRVALARGDAAHDPDRRLQRHREILRRAGQRLVRVHREPRRVRRRARRVGHQADDGPRHDRVRPAAVIRQAPREHRAPLVRDVVEDRADGREPRARVDPRRRHQLRQAFEPHRHHRHVPHLAHQARTVARRRRRSLALGLARPRHAHRRHRARLRVDGERLRQIAADQVGQRLLHRRVVHQLLPRQHRPGDGAGHVAGRLKAIVRARRQRAQGDGLQLGRQVGRERGRRLERPLLHGLEERLVVELPERRAQREQLVEHDAERVDVAPAIDLLPPRLLGRHVPDLALEHAGLVAEEAGAGDAEVGDLHHALVRHEDVLRRDVAVHDGERHAPLVAPLVGVVQPLRGLGHDERGHGRRDARALLPGRGDHPAEIEPLDVLHREEQPLLAVIGELVDLDDVRVVEPGRELRLLHEHRPEPPRRPVRREDALDDEQLVRALGPPLLGEEDLGHPARAQAVEDLEVGELLRGLGHSGGAAAGGVWTYRAGARHLSLPQAHSGMESRPYARRGLPPTHAPHIGVDNMAHRRRVAAITALALSALPLFLESQALAQAPPPAKPPPAAPPPAGKKPDAEFDPDAKPKEPPPLPPAEAGQWGVGGKEEEGKFAPGGDKKKREDADRAKQEEEDKRPVDLGPKRRASLDTVIGFGGMRYLVGDTGGEQNQTKTVGASFIFGFDWRFFDIWDLGVRLPFTRASANGPSDKFNTFALGNFELHAKPSFQITRRLRIPAEVALYLPTAQGDVFPDVTASDKKVAIAQVQMNQAAASARGWEEQPLFSPHRLGIRLGGGITWDASSMHVAAGMRFDLMPKVGGGDAYAGYEISGVTYAWTTHASFHYDFLDGMLEPGLRAWLAVAKLPVHTTARDDSGAQFVLEPQVNGRFPVNADKSMAVKAGIGFILPVAGPLGGGGAPFNAAIKGFRINAQFEF
ncbi:MAG: hypothetical protein QM820_11595 [Minicystis sp.]